MTIGIKVRNFSLNKDKMEGTFDKRADGLGWGPGYEKKFEGVERNSIRYGKNYQKMAGICLKCDKCTGKKGTAGEHCSLPGNEACQK